MALVLIGETDDYGAPTLLRPVALADYLPEPEGEALGEARALPKPTTMPTAPATVNGLDVQLRVVRLDEGSLFVDVRFFNPQPDEVVVTADDVWVIFGFVSNPNGVRHTAVEFDDMPIPSGAAMDTTIRFPWNGRDPYARLGLAGWVFAVTLLEA